MKANERARLDVKAEGVHVMRVRGERGWHLKAVITLTNIGRGRAYISSSGGRFVVRPLGVDPPSLQEEIAFSLAIPVEFIRPND